MTRNTMIFVTLLLIMIMIGYGDQDLAILSCEQEPQDIVNSENRLLIHDGVTSLLGKQFHEVVQLLGEPQDEGFSNFYGPHDYILYQYSDGIIHLGSPEGLTSKTVVSIIVTDEIEVLGAHVGMTFSEIEAIIGQSDHGPDFGMDEIFYLMYEYDGGNTHVGFFTVTFSANRLDGPTHEAFIKWESFDPFTNDEA